MCSSPASDSLIIVSLIVRITQFFADNSLFLCLSLIPNYNSGLTSKLWQTWKVCSDQQKTQRIAVPNIKSGPMCVIYVLIFFALSEQKVTVIDVLHIDFSSVSPLSSRLFSTILSIPYIRLYCSNTTAKCVFARCHCERSESLQVQHSINVISGHQKMRV